jgi:hypothetical protein
MQQAMYATAPSTVGNNGKDWGSLAPSTPLKVEGPAEETMSILQTIREQVVSDVDAKTASTGLELEAEHWQWKEADRWLKGPVVFTGAR